MKKIVACIVVCGFIAILSGVCGAAEYPVNKTTSDELKALGSEQATFTAELQKAVVGNIVSKLDAADALLGLGTSTELTVINSGLSSLYKMLQIEASHGANSQFDSKAIGIIKDYINNTSTFIDGTMKDVREAKLGDAGLSLQFAKIPEYLTKDKELLNKILQELGK